MSASSRSTGILLLLATIGVACSLGGGEKAACITKDDCRAGRVCMDGHCQAQAGGGDAAAGTGGAGDAATADGSEVGGGSAGAGDGPGAGGTAGNTADATGGDGTGTGGAGAGGSGIEPIPGATLASLCPECAPGCGDSKQTGNEACDDGNFVDSDDCSNDCQLPRCGDGITQRNEYCDEGQGGGLRCTADCNWVKFRDVAAWGRHGCAVRVNGSVVCFGQCFTSECDPPKGAFQAIAAGEETSCGLREDGTVSCWGSVTTAPEGTFEQIAAGKGFACARRGEAAGGTVTCWGDGPGGVSPPGSFRRIAAGAEAACGIQPNGRVSCWGQPQAVVAMAPTGSFEEIAVGTGGACAIGTGGSRCWGGELPHPQSDLRGIFVGNKRACGLRDGQVVCWHGMDPDISGLGSPRPAGRMVKAAVTDEQTCALGEDGLVSCWGWLSGAGEYSPTARPLRQAVSPSGRLVLLSLDGSLPPDSHGPKPSGPFVQSDFFKHGCAVRADGSVACWGFDQDGDTRPAPGSYRQVVVGDSFSCGLLVSGEVACWGANDEGQSAPPAGPFVRLSAGYRHACGLHSDGKVECWGGESRWQPHPAPAGEFVELTSGGDASCAVKVDGSVNCWGPGGLGRILPPQQIRRLSVGESTACGLSPTGQPECWGSGYSARMRPRGGFRSVTATQGTCGMRRNGTLVCWSGNRIINRDNEL
jgi:cysteine-rich repeat protein